MLDNRTLAQFDSGEYTASMTIGGDFRARVLSEMEGQGMNKADLSRKSGVAYHAIDKFLKGATASMSAERTKAIADALGISLAGDEEYEELRSLFFQLPEDRREFLLDQLRALASQEKP